MALSKEDGNGVGIRVETVFHKTVGQKRMFERLKNVKEVRHRGRRRTSFMLFIY